MSKLPCCEKGWVDSFRSEEARQIAKYDRLKELDLFVLDNSIRETSIGQLKGHTAEDKFRIYEESAKCGFKVCSNDCMTTGPHIGMAGPLTAIEHGAPRFSRQPWSPFTPFTPILIHNPFNTHKTTCRAFSVVNEFIMPSKSTLFAKSLSILKIAKSTSHLFFLF